MLSPARLLALLHKEMLDLSRSRAAITPMVITLATLVIPFVIAIGVPHVTGEPLSTDRDMEKALRAAAPYWSALESLGPEAALQAFFFQQFLMLIVLVPVTGALAFASSSIVGEKQARTLEPLLATPATTLELLLAKVLAALVPSLAAELVAFAAYVSGIALLAAPGVLGAFLSARTLLVVLVLAPIATLIALQLAVIASSRVGDARTAQQIGTLVVLPIVGVLIGQSTGAFFLTVPLLLLASAVLMVVWGLLFLFGVAVFDRERILTKWT